MLRLAEKDWIHPMEWELDRVCHRISSDQIFTIIMKASTVGLPRRLVWCGKESRIYSCWFGACPCVHHALLIILACFTLFLNLLVCILGPPGIVPWACLFLDLHSQSLLWQFVRVQTSNTKDFINCIPRDLASLQFPLKNACSICPRRFSVFPLAHFYSSSSYTNLETCTFFFFLSLAYVYSHVIQTSIKILSILITLERAFMPISSQSPFPSKATVLLSIFMD